LIVLNEDATEAVPLIGHPIEGYSDGFAFIGRWMRLALACLEDLQRQFRSASTDFWSKTGLLVLIPVFSDRYEAEGAFDDAFFLTNYVEPLLEQAKLPVAPSSRRVVLSDECGLALASLQVRHELQESHDLERFILLSADSYVEHASLTWLRSEGRLKMPDNPDGLMAGEAGVCIMVEPAAGKRDSVTSIGGIGYTQPAEALLGDGLAETVEMCLDEAMCARPFRGELFADLNGETWRAENLGRALVKLQRDRLAENTVQTLCGSVGDTGIAADMLNLCYAARARERGYATSSDALLLRASALGTHSALYVTSTKS
jgi:3-oxoacyl-[acyl-carrier-protein] synthase-1